MSTAVGMEEEKETKYAKVIDGRWAQKRKKVERTNTTKKSTLKKHPNKQTNQKKVHRIPPTKIRYACFRWRYRVALNHGPSLHPKKSTKY